MSLEHEQTVIEIPNGPEVNFLIGGKGAGINALQDATGTRIQIQRAHEVPAGALSRKVTITGGEAQRSACALLIQTKVTECQQRDAARINGKRKFGDGTVGALDAQGAAAAAAGTQQDHTMGQEPQMVIEIPNGPEVNFLIGGRGIGIKALQDATGTRIQIQRTHDVPAGAIMRSVTILGGDEAQRAQCAQMIQQKVHECQQRDQARISAHKMGGFGGTGNLAGGYGGMGMAMQGMQGNLAGGYGGMGMAMHGNLAAGMGNLGAGGFGGYGCTGMGTGMPVQGDLTETVIEIPNGPAVNYLIGSKGAGVNALQAATGTRIFIQRSSEVAPGALNRTVKIVGGNAQQQYACAQQIQSKVLECQQRDQARANGGGGMPVR
jgi:transcription antitermination factor NusA-like protein